MKTIFFFIFLAFFSGTINGAERGPFVVDCKLLSSLVGIDQLSKFERIAGSYQLDKKKLKLRDVNKYGWSHVVIPDYNYDIIQKFNEPFQRTEFSVKNKNVTVSVFSRSYSSTRQQLSKVVSAETYAMYREKPFFSYLDNALGLYVGKSNFCADMPEISISMFMASGVLPIYGDLTHVYRLKNPDALLLVPATGKKTAVYFIFPNSENRDTIDYVMVHAPEADIIEIVNALKRI
jgi:hypothetical protein